MNKKSNKTAFILITILLITNVIWAVQYFSLKSDWRKTDDKLNAIVQNKKILAFQKLFIDKVLKAEGEVDFDTRVMLQNSVNETGDSEVIEAWNNFLKSKTEADGQERVKDLLSLLSSKAYSL